MHSRVGTSVIGYSTCCFSHSQSISLVWREGSWNGLTLCRAGDVDPKAWEKHSSCCAAHKASIIAVWATPFASHWNCCLAHQHRQLKTKRGKTSACLFKMLSKGREAGDLREKGRFVVSNFHPHPPSWNLPLKLLFKKTLKEERGKVLKEAFMSAKMWVH